MGFLDVKTILISYALTNAVCLVVVAFLWYHDRKRFSGLSFWVADYSLQLAAIVLILLRGRIPDILSIVAANAAVMAGALIFLMGMERFLSKKGPQIHNFCYLALFVAIHAHFTLARPDLAARNLNIATGLFFYTVQIVWLLSGRAAPEIRPLTRGPALVFTAYAALSLIRIAVFFTAPEPGQDFFRSGSNDALVLLCYQMLFVIQTYSLVLLVNRLLLERAILEEEKFSKAFHSSPSAVTITRLSDGRIFEVNEGFFTITGYDRSEVEGRTTVELNLWAREEDRAKVVAELSTKGRIHGAEFQFRDKSGRLLTGIFSAEIIALKGERCVISSISDITARVNAEMERKKLIGELRDALEKVKVLRGLLPICANCKKIRNDQGYWEQIEVYIMDRSDANFSHGICPDCEKALYGDLAEEE